MIFAEVWEGHLEASSWLLWAPWRPSGGLLEASWGPLEAFSGSLGSLLGPLGGLLRVLEVDLKLNIILVDLHFSAGPSWSCLGVVFSLFSGHF